MNFACLGGLQPSQLLCPPSRLCLLKFVCLVCVEISIELNLLHLTDRVCMRALFLDKAKAKPDAESEQAWE